MSSTHNLFMKAGDSFAVTYHLYEQIPDPDNPGEFIRGDLLDLTGYRVAAEIRPSKRASSTTAPPVTSFEVTISPTELGRLDLVLSARRSESLLSVKNPAWDLQVIDADNWVTTYIEGTITVSQDVTSLPEDIQ